jgi:3-phenylpropionate/trans-cinnamate dioxygenase ferredoxin reductase component
VSDAFELLIVGGGPAGFSTARAYREAGGSGAVGIVADERRMPYQRPPLTKELLRGESSEDELPLEEEQWLTSQRVALVSGRAVSLEPDQRAVALSGGRILHYGTCVITTGAEPTRLAVPGADDPAVRVVRALDDVRELLARLRDGGHVVVIGSGFIGCEISASLRIRGNPVTLISDEPAPNQARLGPEPAQELRRWLEEDGVDARFGQEVESIERDGTMLEVRAGATRARAEVVIMAAGVAPRSELPAGAGLELQDGAVPADSAMRTTLPGVLAAGDVCVAENAAAGRRLRVEHWGDALGQGEVAGTTAAGRQAAWSDVPGFWSTIGGRTLKYAAWGDGFDELHVERGSNGGFAAWYGRDGRVVGVLAHGSDDAYERGSELIKEGASWEW